MVKNLPANAGDMGSIPGLERSPGEGNDTKWTLIINCMFQGVWQSKHMHKDACTHRRDCIALHPSSF